MANFPNQQKIKTELQESTTEIPLSCDHLTTCNYGEPFVINYRHNTPREKFTQNISAFCRPMPMQVPLMAKATHKMATFYVPFRTISPQWNAFITKEPYIPYNAGNTPPIQVSEMPFFLAGTMAKFIRMPQVSRAANPGEQPDFTIWQTGTSYPVVLTAFGRHAVKIFNQLGYAICIDLDAKHHIDAMALLAYAKVFCDFYYNSAYSGIVQANIEVQQLFKKDAATAYQINEVDMFNIFTLTKKVFYEQDYFTSCFDNPASPNEVGTSIGRISLEDITTNEGTQIYSDETDTATDGTAAIGLKKVLSQYAIDTLKKLNDYCMRYALSGVRAVDRYLARFGVLLSAEKMKRSIFYGEQETPVEFGAVFSTASTADAKVGDYAGNGIINSDHGEHKEFEIESEEYGIILTIGSIIPKIGYYQGMDRNNMHHEVETYFSGVFDQLGNQAVSAAELYTSNHDATFAGDTQFDAIFGYLPRGVEYKTARDKCTGDFRNDSMNTGANSYHLFREFDDNYFNTNGVKHNPDFTQMLDSEQYLRGFNETTEDGGDHFICMYQISASARIHAKPLYDTYDFESEGKEILIKGNGPKQN